MEGDIMTPTFTLSEAISRINMMLNYPAISYEDVGPFFDTAIADLNTTLHTELKSVTNMIKEYRHYMSKNIGDRVLITSEPDESTVIPESNVVPATKPAYYFDTTRKQYGIKRANEYHYTASLYGVYNNMGRPQFYKAVRYGMGVTFWINDTSDNPNELDLLEYFTEDWITLYLIPYVCFKYTVKDGGTATIFADEYSQGFQQLQNSYSVPEKVLLATYCDKLAYRADTEEFLPNLNVKVPTKAITKDMLHARQVNAVYGNMYDRGGFYD